MDWAKVMYLYTAQFQWFLQTYVAIQSNKTVFSQSFVMGENTFNFDMQILYKTSSFLHVKKGYIMI